MSTRVSTAAATLAVHAGTGPDPASGALVPPIQQSTTYALDGLAGARAGHTYSRVSNPTVAALEARLGALEGSPPAVACASGLAAIATLLLSTLEAGDHVVVSRVVYGGTVRVLRDVLAPLGVRATYVDGTDPAAVEAALEPATRLVLVESPGNPTLELADLAAVARIAHAGGALLAVDNTFLTPLHQRPLELGADVSLYSTTKLIEGHAVATGGAIVARDDELLERCRAVRTATGSIQKPFDAWLTLRGLATLPLRLERHAASALTVARALEGHPAVLRTRYPGLPSHPQHDLARRQQASGGSIVTIELAGAPAADRFIRALALVTPAEHLGTVETLATHCATTTHATVPETDRLALGITPGLVRLSIGLEEPADLTLDLTRALDAVSTAAREEVTS